MPTVAVTSAFGTSETSPQMAPARPGTRLWYMARVHELSTVRSPHEVFWRLIQENVDGNTGKNLGTAEETRREYGGMTNTNPGNSVAQAAFNKLASGLLSLLANPSRKYLHFEPMEFVGGEEAEDEDAIHDAKEWLAKAEKQFYRYIEDTNFYDRLQAAFRELALYGTCALGATEDEKDIVSFTSYTAGLYYIAEDNGGRISTFYHLKYPTVEQIADEYLRPLENNKAEYDRVWNALPEKVRQDYQAGRLYNQYELVIGYIPNDNHDIPGGTAKGGLVESAMSRRMSLPFELKMPKAAPAVDDNDPTTWPVKEVRFLAEDQGSSDPEALLRVRFHKHMPVWVTRWELPTDDIYGIGPGKRALSEIMRLQQYIYFDENHLAHMLSPPLQAPLRLKDQINELDFGPGSTTFHTDDVGGQGQAITPIWQSNANLNHMLAREQEIERKIQKLCFNDLFDPISRATEAGGNKTATQIVIADRERVLQLTGVGQIAIRSLLKPLGEYMIYKMVEAGVLEPPPESIGDMPFRIRASNIVDVAQRQGEKASLIEWMNMVAPLQESAFGDALLVSNPLKWGETLFDTIGVPIEVKNSPAEIKRFVRAREEAQQQALAQQHAMAQAQAAKDATAAGANEAKAAKDASEIEDDQ